jgi:hypothetical protein
MSPYWTLVAERVACGVAVGSAEREGLGRSDADSTGVPVLGDADGDGLPDWLAHATSPTDAISARPRGTVRTFSILSGTPLRLASVHYG